MDVHQKSNDSKQFVLAAVIIGVVLLICTIIGSSTLVKIKSLGNTIRVTGAASKAISADYAIWNATVSARAASVDSAYPILESDLKKIIDFLKKRGFDSTSYYFGAANINKSYNREGQIVDYVLSRTIKIEMADVTKVSAISAAASELLKVGVMIESHQPQFIVSNLDTLKVEMIRAATENAKIRAEELVKTTGNTIGAPRSASIGVFQIRPRHSQEVSGYGISDISSIEKEIVLTVHIEFLID
jgi:hypothetical protein